MNTVVVSEMDREFLRRIRENVTRFVAECGRRFDTPGRVLDVAPQDHEGAAPHFREAKVQTLDIDPASGADFIADLCADNSSLISDGAFDAVVCTEVLEHTLNPFAAVAEIHRVLKPGGLVFLSAPFNFRIHGPLPDCWRFTEHGLRALLARFEIVELGSIPTPGRELMPIHYTVIARKRA